MFAVIFGLFGLIIGSFLNVVILRKGVRSLGGRSSCMSCGRELPWYDLIPVFSWLALRGRCRECGSRISIQYPLVEAASGILFALVGGALVPESLAVRALFCVIATLCIVIFVYDLRHTIIPDAWVYSFGALALITGLFLYPAAPFWLALLSGPIAAAPLFLLWLISRGAWMGFGDVKLALGMGWLLGPVAGLIAVWGAFTLGALTLLPVLLFQRIVTHMRAGGKAAAGLTMRSEVPFGPFLVASCLLVWFLQLYAIALPIGLP